MPYPLNNLNPYNPNENNQITLPPTTHSASTTDLQEKFDAITQPQNPETNISPSKFPKTALTSKAKTQGFTSAKANWFTVPAVNEPCPSYCEKSRYENGTEYSSCWDASHCQKLNKCNELENGDTCLATDIGLQARCVATPNSSSFKNKGNCCHEMCGAGCTQPNSAMHCTTCRYSAFSFFIFILKNSIFFAENYSKNPKR